MRYIYVNVFGLVFSVKFFTFLLYNHVDLIAKSGLLFVGPQYRHDHEEGPRPWVDNHWHV